MYPVTGEGELPRATRPPEDPREAPIAGWLWVRHGQNLLSPFITLHVLLFQRPKKPRPGKGGPQLALRVAAEAPGPACGLWGSRLQSPCSARHLQFLAG